MKLTILLPCLNEAETIETCFQKALHFLNVSQQTGEILIADNGSTDGSQEIAQNIGARIVSVAEKGYGSALIGGISAANGDYIVMGDADDSYDFSNLESFIAKLDEGYDVVRGNRFKGGIKKGAMPFLHRYLGNPVLSFIGKLFFGIKINDFHCGLRAFRRDSILKLDLKCTGMEFASEMIVKASFADLKIAEVPTILYKDGRSRPPHLKTWRDGWRHLRFLLMFSPVWLFLYPGLLLMGLGLLVSTILIFGTINLFGAILDVHTLLYSSAMLIIGFQSASFYFFTKIFAVQEGLLPDSKTVKDLSEYINLEKGLIFGLILLLAGFYLSINALSAWNNVNFGELDSRIVLRKVIPAVTSLILGFQIVLYSFFYSILGLKQKI
ncbi:MAG: glycosyltransferase family 2 protein [Cytophagales bacterium]